MENCLSDKKRINEQLLCIWQQLCGENPMPALSELNSDLVAGIWDDCFLVQVNPHAQERKDHHYLYLGRNVAKTFGGDLTDPSVLERPERITDSYIKIVEHPKPIIEEGEFTNLNNNLVKFRQILLPLGNDHENVDHILGGMRCKEFDSE